VSASAGAPDSAALPSPPRSDEPAAALLTIRVSAVHGICHELAIALWRRNANETYRQLPNSGAPGGASRRVCPRSARPPRVRARPALAHPPLVLSQQQMRWRPSPRTQSSRGKGKHAMQARPTTPSNLAVVPFANVPCPAEGFLSANPFTPSRDKEGTGQRGLRSWSGSRPPHVRG